MIKTFRILGLLALLGSVGMLPLAKADQFDHQTKVTINEPVDVSGTVLPPGQYIFKLADDQADRSIVQIFNEDQTHLMATILAIPAYRLEPTDNTVITLEERPGSSADAIGKWFFAGQLDGVEFLNHQ